MYNYILKFIAQTSAILRATYILASIFVLVCYLISPNGKLSNANILSFENNQKTETKLYACNGDNIVRLFISEAAKNYVQE